MTERGVIGQCFICGHVIFSDEKFASITVCLDKAKKKFHVERFCSKEDFANESLRWEELIIAKQRQKQNIKQ